jgi:hypothetical protein
MFPFKLKIKRKKAKIKRESKVRGIHEAIGGRKNVRRDGLKEGVCELPGEGNVLKRRMRRVEVWRSRWRWRGDPRPN